MTNINDEDLKKHFKSRVYETPSEIDLARWNKSIVLRRTKQQNQQSWKIAAAVVAGFFMGLSTFYFTNSGKEEKNFASNATIEHVHVNLD